MQLKYRAVADRGRQLLSHFKTLSTRSKAPITRKALMDDFTAKTSVLRAEAEMALTLLLNQGRLRSEGDSLAAG